MKSLLTLGLAFSAAFTTLAQPPKADSTALKTKQDESLSLYRRALAYDDLGTASAAITTYLMAGGSNAYEDTLALLYYQSNNLRGAYKLAGELNARDAKNLVSLNLLADISGRAGETKTSLEWYEKLCAQNPQAFNFYQLATKQFMLERKKECRESLMKVVADSAQARQQSTVMDIGNGYTENVPVLAATYNMLGVLAFQDKNNAEARKYYELALSVHPQFVIGKQNLESLDPKKPAASGKPAAKAPAKPAGK
jgi:tetratricopeptide (TPR) repeat protein